MLGNLLGGFIIIVVAVNLMPIVADAVAGAQGGNVTGAASTILGLTTLFFALSIATVSIAIAIEGLRAAGLVGF